MAEQWELALVGRRLVSFGFVNGTSWDIGLRVKAGHLQFAILDGVHHIVLGALGDENHVAFRKGQSFAIQYHLDHPRLEPTVANLARYRAALADPSYVRCQRGIRAAD